MSFFGILRSGGGASASQIPVVSATGFFRVNDRHEQTVIIQNDNSTQIVTGHDLTQATGMTLKFRFADASGAHAWSVVELDVDTLLSRYNNNVAQDASMNIFSNDYIRIDIIDPTTGEFLFRDAGREFSYLWSELWIAREQPYSFPAIEMPVFVANALADIIPVDVSNTNWSVSTGNASTGQVRLQSAEYHQIGNARHYRIVLSAQEDAPYSFGVDGAIEIRPTYHQHFRLGSGDFAAGQATFERVGPNELRIDRDDNIDVLCRVDLFFTAYMPSV